MMRMKNAIAHNDYKDVSLYINIYVVVVKNALLIKLPHIAHNDYKDGNNGIDGEKDAIDQVTSPSKSKGALHCAAIFSFKAFVLRS